MWLDHNLMQWLHAISISNFKSLPFWKEQRSWIWLILLWRHSINKKLKIEKNIEWCIEKVSWKFVKKIVKKHKFKGANVALIRVVKPMITIESQMGLLNLCCLEVTISIGWSLHAYIGWLGTNFYNVPKTPLLCKKL